MDDSIANAQGPVGEVYEVVLPLPPGVNGLYPTVKRGATTRRVKSQAYKDWLNEATTHATAQAVHMWTPADNEAEAMPKRRTNQWAVSVRVVMRDRRRDMDGVAKALLDFLADRLWLDDRYVDRLLMERWHGQQEYLLVVVEVLPDGVHNDTEDPGNPVLRNRGRAAASTRHRRTG